MTKKKASGFNQPFEALKDLKKQLEAEEQAAKDAKHAPKHAPPATHVPKQKPLSEHDAAEEEVSFHRMMAGVKPLDARGRVPLSQHSVDRATKEQLEARRTSAKSTLEAEAEAVHEHLRTLVEAKARFEVSDDGKRVEGRRIDLPPDALRKLRRGLLPIDARADLHGLRAGEARAAVETFLREKRERGERCVLVVHGKGEHSPRGLGVLRGEIAAWLSQGAASEHVAAFATATDADGGEGAIYVLLRRDPV